ncbi:MAG TPA: PASTA domain-containing protein [Candidatus Rifleibacterium sp.]|nr:PASTA domain-containing protein [Candidatus Rifleibacterium sp.]HPT44750.1 PASTA domain-containing protein [Candidatus Rifleibacterium sp.]
MTRKKSDSCLSILIKMSILMSILVAVLVGGVYFAYNKLNEFFNRGGTIIVPDFRGKHIVEVMKSKPSGLEVVRRDEKFDDRYSKDHVIAQFPEPGTVVKPGKQVLVSISLGLQKVSVPDLVGSSMREVDVSLMNAQLSTGERAYLFSDKIAPDRIVGQSPLPSEEYGVNKDVDLLISLGRKPEVLTLPNLTGVSLDDAKNRLKAWGLNFGRIFSKPDRNREKFQIISTSPSPYSQLRRGEVVSLLVSSGSDEGTATPADLKKFEVFSPVETAAAQPVKPVVPPAPKTPAGNATPAVAPVTASPADPAPPQVIVEDDDEAAYAAPVVQAAPRISAPVVDREMSFVMPDGFMPKEVKFIHITPDGRQQVYAGAHKPLELVKVKVPVVPNSKVQIYINDVPVEERRVEP